MIARHARGKAVGFQGAVAGRVYSVEHGTTVLHTTVGERLVLSSAPAEGPSARGLYAIRNVVGFEPGDVLLLDDTGTAELLFRATWQHNSILVTQRCDSLCVMCSQPPRDIDDSPRVDALIEAVKLLPPGASSVTITGGEPSLLGDRLVHLVEAIRAAAPEAGVHVLSNGRGFRVRELAARLGAVGHPDLMVGIPLYADYDELHDHVVGAVGAFDQTLFGLENLGRARVPIEIRVVLHRLTVPRLEALCTFVARNLPYVTQVVMMGLEPTGYAVPNLEALWIDPVEYAPTLARAVDLLTAHGLRARIYNVQLCALPPELWPFATRSISEWKNEYLPDCEGCSVRDTCCGFFSSAVTRKVVTRGLQPVPREVRPST